METVPDAACLQPAAKKRKMCIRDRLHTDKEKFDQFINFLTINVSEFYRNPEQWKFLDEEVFPALIKQFGSNLKIWSAACSTGDEPYSLVMALSKHVPLNQIHIIATDRCV